MLNPFEIGSAPIDWCENNYAITRYVAEFYNTISNFLFFILPPILIYLFIPYGKQFSKAIHLVWVLLFVIGIFSTYFHATLSLAGQLLDEIAILWVIHVVFAIWFPRRLLPHFFQENMNRFKWTIFGIGVACTYLSCIAPSINAFVLMSFGIPATVLLIQELKKCRCNRIYRLGLRSSLMWGLALISWILDRALCHPYLNNTFPYLHSLWHVFIVLATYGICVLFAYFHAVREAPLSTGIPVLRYWPNSLNEFETLDSIYTGNKHDHCISEDIGYLEESAKYICHKPFLLQFWHSITSKDYVYDENNVKYKFSPPTSPKKSLKYGYYHQYPKINFNYITQLLKELVFNSEMGRIPYVVLVPANDLSNDICNLHSPNPCISLSTSLPLPISKAYNKQTTICEPKGLKEIFLAFQRNIGCTCLGCRCFLSSLLQNTVNSNPNF